MINIKQFIDRVIRFQKGLETHFIITLKEEDNKHIIIVEKKNITKENFVMPLKIIIKEKATDIAATNSWRRFLHYILFEK